MSCCGEKRTSMSASPAVRPVTFEYLGNGTMTVVGAATRKVYWFSGPGARIEIRAQDADSLSGVPHLLRVVTSP
jgi:hypothetical protein